MKFSHHGSLIWLVFAHTKFANLVHSGYMSFLFSTLSHWPLVLKQAIFNIFYDYAKTLFPHEMRNFAGLELRISFLSTIYFLIAASFNNRLFEKSALHCDRFTEQSALKINISCLFLWDSLEGYDEQCYNVTTGTAQSFTICISSSGD